jgi:putative addiction module component (TIGR02574 family)
MAKNAEQVLRDALELPEAERADLACALLDSLEAEAPDVLRSPEEWDAEIDRRVEAALAGEPGLSWEEAKAELRQQLTRE